MKITDVKLRFAKHYLFVQVYTDAGIVGLGEAGNWGYLQATAAAIEKFATYLIGKDPFRIEDYNQNFLRSVYFRGSVIMSAISAIDIALWDIKGKFFNAPVYQLMGGACRDNMRVYSWIGGDRPSDVGAAALERKNAGFTAIKMYATEELQMIDTYDKVDAVLERVAAIRESCGKYFGIAIDFHGRVHKPMAKVLAKKLEEFDPMFIEEPVLCENMEVFKEIAAACNVPIATGERLFTKYDFKRLLQAGGVDIIPDGDVMGVVDAFVAEHPDFSYQGHKGTIALTGFQGAFGYDYDIPEQADQLRVVAAALKEHGWNFASHSYTHNRVNNFYGPGCSVEKISYDINKWVEHVVPCIGETRLFIAPFGYRVQQPAL